MTSTENDAVAAMEAVLKALTSAVQLSETAGYGSNVLEPLMDAQRDVRYAIDTATGRN